MKTRSILISVSILALTWTTATSGSNRSTELARTTSITEPVQIVQSNQVSFRAVPGTIAFQGFLTDSAGTPVEGSVNLDVALYDVYAAGTPLWGPESHLGVTVDQGVFQIALGCSTAFPAGLFSSQPLYLGVRVNSEPELARTQLHSAPFAMRTAVADSAAEAGHAAVADSALTGGGGPDDDWIISGNDMHANVSGTVGIGTTSPTNKLDVQGGNISVNGFRVSGFIGSAEATGGNTGDNTWQDIPGVSLDYSLNAPMVVNFRSFGSVQVNASIAMFRFVIDGVPYGEPSSGERYCYCQYWAWLPFYMERDVAQNAGAHSVKVQFKGSNANSKLITYEDSRTHLKVEAR